MFTKLQRPLIAAICAAMAFAGTAQIASATPAPLTATGTIPVSAVIVDSCTLAVNPLAFGTYAQLALTGTTIVTTNCTLGGMTTLSASNGSHVTGSFQRNMSNSTNTSSSTVLPYNLYTDSARSVVWGDGTNSTATISLTGTGNTVNTTIYGNIPASSVLVPGTYNDSVVVTLTY